MSLRTVYHFEQGWGCQLRGLREGVFYSLMIVKCL